MTDFYLTTTLPYINAKPHLGFAWEILTADFICRYHRALGETVVFNTGTDEHGQKVWQKAQENQLTPQQYTDQLVTDFIKLKELLNLSITNFIRTTDEHHQRAAQEFWRRCLNNGDIYKKKYQVKYCVGCELEKTDRELVDGCCPLHPHQPLELRDEENYFFRFSRYSEKLLELYQQRPDFVIGEGKMTEITSFVQRGLQDFSISRLKEKMPWGVAIPDDDEQVMYVWFDALVNYLSTLGWPEDETNFKRFWPAVQICGKDNLRQQAAMWQAMLMSAGLPTSKQILINGFITVDGAKMSKSVGNVIDPASLVDRYGTETTRFLLASLPVFVGDADITTARLHDFYTAHLTNGLGNLASRVAKLAASLDQPWQLPPIDNFSAAFTQAMAHYQTATALQVIIGQVDQVNNALSQQKPWLMTDQAEKQACLRPMITAILQIAYDLQIFMPQTSQKLAAHFMASHVQPMTPLFPRQ